jgi:type I restriction enzyme, S subunit
MTTRMVSLDQPLVFLNGRAPVVSDLGQYRVYGSNGPIGHSEDANHEQAIVLGRVGAYCGSVAISHEPFWASDNTIVVKPKGHQSLRYWYYRLLTLPLRNFAGGAAQPLLTHTILRGIEAPIFEDPHLQSRIADILTAYDDLIENNRRRMALLEEAARQLYREWFVRLRFPGHEHIRITNGVPEGWERKPVEELTSFLSRGIAPQYDDDAEGLVINQKCIRGGQLDLSLARHQSREFKPDRQVQHGDVLVNSTGEGTLGRVAQVLAPVDNCTVDTHVTIVRPVPGIGIHYFGRSLMEWEARFSTMGRGATNQTELSRGQIGEVRILVPQRSLVQQFEDVAGSSFRQAWVLMEQNEKLRAARDLLLPRLMSGEIAV